MKTITIIISATKKGHRFQRESSNIRSTSSLQFSSHTINHRWAGSMLVNTCIITFSTLYFTFHWHSCTTPHKLNETNISLNRAGTSLNPIIHWLIRLNSESSNMSRLRIWNLFDKIIVHQRFTLKLEFNPICCSLFIKFEIRIYSLQK